MKAALLPAALVLLALAPGCSGAGEPVDDSARFPFAAGRYYPASPARLEAELDALLHGAPRCGEAGRLLGLVVPHASYHFSGKTAAAGFRQLEGRKLDLVFLIGSAHQAGFPGVSIPDYQSYRTPLGEVAVDTAAAARLREAAVGIASLPAVHLREHSLEVEVPFIQRILPGARMVPVLVGRADRATLAALSRALARELCRTPTSVLICSTDLVHYPNKASAERIDPGALDAVASLDPVRVEAYCDKWMGKDVPGLVCVMCAREAVLVALRAVTVAGAVRGIVLDASDSADAPPFNRERVVGYGAVAFYGEGAAGETVTAREVENMEEEGRLSEDSRKTLLEEARRTLSAAVRGNPLPDEKVEDPFLQGEQGAFVTLTRGGKLRGCIGRFTAREPLYSVVREMAEQAALHDPRFSPVASEELSDIRIEISVLSPMRRVADPAREVELGRHGIYVRRGWRSGTYLPQVAVEHDMSLEEFLGSCCAHKAGLAPDAWRDPETEVYVYTAEVFGE